MKTTIYETVLIKKIAINYNYFSFPFLKHLFDVVKLKAEMWCLSMTCSVMQVKISDKSPLKKTLGYEKTKTWLENQFKPYKIRFLKLLNARCNDWNNRFSSLILDKGMSVLNCIEAGKKSNFDRQWCTKIGWVLIITWCMFMFWLFSD